MWFFWLAIFYALSLCNCIRCFRNCNFANFIWEWFHFALGNRPVRRQALHNSVSWCCDAVSRTLHVQPGPGRSPENSRSWTKTTHRQIHGKVLQVSLPCHPYTLIYSDHSLLAKPLEYCFLAGRQCLLKSLFRIIRSANLSLRWYQYYSTF